eukprot:SAG31_NODE_3023_length_4780_cov_5.085665_2_plen_60_part_00
MFFVFACLCVLVCLYVFVFVYRVLSSTKFSFLSRDTKFRTLCFLKTMHNKVILCIPTSI